MGPDQDGHPGATRSDTLWVSSQQSGRWQLDESSGLGQDSHGNVSKIQIYASGSQTFQQPFTYVPCSHLHLLPSPSSLHPHPGFCPELSCLVVLPGTPGLPSPGKPDSQEPHLSSRALHLLFCLVFPWFKAAHTAAPRKPHRLVTLLFWACVLSCPRQETDSGQLGSAATLAGGWGGNGSHCLPCSG